MSVATVIALMWLVTYPSRLLGLSLGRLNLPPFWLAFLRFVPVSVFAALIVPDVLGSPEWARRLPAALGRRLPRVRAPIVRLLDAGCVRGAGRRDSA